MHTAAYRQTMKGQKMPGQRFYRQIAAEALPAVRAACDAWTAENGTLDDCEMYLYVYPSGHWVIDRPDYLQDHNTVSAVPIALYTSRTALAHDLWDAEAL